jgi:ribonuclease PH
LRDQYRPTPNGRALEIQRLISRTLRHCVALEHLGENTILVDCDVLQADGGTRVAAINGGIVALYEALHLLAQRQKTPVQLFKRWITAVSCGICHKQQLIDLSYHEDSHACSDCNFIFDENGHFIEIQCSAEKQPLQQDDFQSLLIKSQLAAQKILQAQKLAITGI